MGVKYQLPHYLYFIDRFKDEDSLVKFGIVQKLDYYSENGEFFDTSESFFTVPDANIEDFENTVISVGKKHFSGLGDVILGVYNNRKLPPNLVEKKSLYFAEYASELDKRAIRSLGQKSSDTPIDVLARYEYRRQIHTEIGTKPPMHITDLPLFFFEQIFMEMQKRSHHRIMYFTEHWEEQFVRRGKKINSYEPPDELKSLDTILRPLESYAV